MSNYRNTRSYENLERQIFPGVGTCDIPQLEPVDYEGGCEFIGFNYAKGCKSPEDKRANISSQPTFKRNRDGTVEYSYTETRNYVKEKGGKWQSATKGDLYERTTVYSGRIGKDGLRKENKPVKTEKLVKRGKL